MGLLLRGMQDNMTEALSRKKAFHPAVGFTVDPVPAGRDTSMIPAFKPGVGGIHDPVPATPASEFTEVRGFHPNVGFSVDPIPARMA
jgi:hypothetical protein